MALALVGIDHLKAVNDAEGHVRGELARTASFEPVGVDGYWSLG